MLGIRRYRNTQIDLIVAEPERFEVDLVVHYNKNSSWSTGDIRDTSDNHEKSLDPLSCAQAYTETSLPNLTNFLLQNAFPSLCESFHLAIYMSEFTESSCLPFDIERAKKCLLDLKDSLNILHQDSARKGHDFSNTPTLSLPAPRRVTFVFQDDQSYYDFREVMWDIFPYNPSFGPQTNSHQ